MIDSSAIRSSYTKKKNYNTQKLKK